MISSFSLLIILFSILIVVITVYETIVTKNWRNRVPNEDRYWKLAIIYFNPHDKRAFLPKKSGLGFTINFANPAGVASLIALLALIYYSF